MEGTHTAARQTAEDRCKWMTQEIQYILARNQREDYLCRMLELAHIYERILPDTDAGE